MKTRSLTVTNSDGSRPRARLQGWPPTGFPELAVCALLIGLSLAWPASSLGQAGRLDPGFLAQTDQVSSTSALAVQADGKILFAGNAPALVEVPAVVGRLNSNGTLDPTFPAISLNLGGGASVLGVDAMNRVLVAGSFTNIAGQSRSAIARISATGAVDPTFHPVLNLGAEVLALGIQPDGRLLIAGNFTLVNGTSRAGIARLNQDGSLDPAFDPGTGIDAGDSNAVRALAILPDGGLVIAGSFTSFDGRPRSRVARLAADGSLDLTFDPGEGPNGLVNAVAVQVDGRVILGGQFLTVSGVTRRRLARLQTNGSPDPGFAAETGLSSGTDAPNAWDGEARTLMQQSDGRIVVGGSFRYVHGVRRDGLARLNQDGSLDYDFDVYDGGLSALGFLNVDAIAMQTDGNIVVGGPFDLVNGVPHSGLARVFGAGSSSPGRFELSSAVQRTNEGAGVVVVTVKRTGGSVGTASVKYGTYAGSAQAHFDYTVRSDTLVFAADELEKTFQIPIIDDALAEDEGCCSTWIDPVMEQRILEEVFIVRLDVPTGGAVIGGQNSQIIILQDDDTAFAFASSTYDAGELDGRVPLRVRRVGAVEGTNQVIWSTASTSASGGIDFVSATNTLTFLPGETDKDIRVSILEDELNEGTEGFQVRLSEPTGGATLASPPFTVVRILDRPGTIISTWPGAVDVSFFPEWLDGSVGAIAEGPGGTIYVSGYFYDQNRILPALLRLQPNGAVDLGFRTPDFIEYVWQFVAQPDGHLIVNTTANCCGGQIVRLNADGGLDAGFASNLYSGGTIQAMTRQLDGRVVIAGNFTNINGVTRQWIARLNPDGNVDPGFDVGSGPLEGLNPGPGIYAVAIQPDGRILVGGDFTRLGGISKRVIARLHANGSIDATFDAPVINTTVTKLLVQSDGKIIVGGHYLAINGRSVPLIRLNSDGTPDLSFEPDASLDGSFMSAIGLQHDGKLVLGVNRFNAHSYSVERLHPDGSLDGTFHSGSGPDSSVSTMLIASNGGVLIGGEFNYVNGRQRRGIARLAGGDPPATPPTINRPPASYTVIEGADVTFNVAARAFPLPSFQWSFNGQPLPGATSSNLHLINAALNQAGVYAVTASNPLGSVTSSNASLSVMPAPIHPGSLELAFRPAGAWTNQLEQAYNFAGITSIALQGDDKPIIAAGYTRHRQLGTELHAFLRLDHDGQLDPTFDRVSAISGSVRAVAVQPDGKVLVAGSFYGINSLGHAPLVRLKANGGFDPAFQPEHVNGIIHSVAVLADGKIVVCGEFSAINGVPRWNVARLNGDGSLDVTFDPGTNAIVAWPGQLRSLAVQSDGKVLLVGSSGSSGWVARLEPGGNRDPGFNNALVIDKPVESVAVQPDAKILIGGYFTSIDGVLRSRCTRLKADGSLDPTFEPTGGPNGSVDKLVMQSDGSVLAAGTINVSNELQPWVGRFLPQGTLDAGFNPGGGADGRITSLVLQSDGAVLIGGEFTNVDSRPRFGIAKLRNNADAAGGKLEFNVERLSVTEEAGAIVELRARRVGSTNGLVLANYGVSGNALPGIDFTPVGGLLTFAPGDVDEHIIQVNVLDDLSAEGDEVINVWLANPIGGVTLGQRAASEVNILDNDTAVELAYGDRMINEGAERVAVQIKRWGQISNTCTVHFTTADETARAGTDYVGQDCTVTFSPGQTNQALWVTFMDDRVAEPDESFRLVLNEPAGTQLGTNSSARVSIRDNDRPGTLDTTFAADALLLASFGFGPSPGISALAVQSDGRILVGGMFWDPLGQLPFGLVRLWPNGTMDFSFPPGGWSNGVAVAMAVTAIVLQPDGKSLIVDRYSSGPLRLRDDGSLDETFVSPLVEGGPILVLAVQTDGKILMGGRFTSVNGILRNSLARLNANGSLDETFDPGSGVLRIFDGGEEFPGTVYALTVLADRRILVAGQFDAINGTSRSGVARLTATGTVDSTFDPGSGLADSEFGSGNAFASAMALQSDGRILVGGCFTHVNGFPRANLARLHESGAVDADFASTDLPCSFSFIEPNPPLLIVAVQPDDRILVGGAFCAGLSCTNLLRLNSDGSADETFGSVEFEGTPSWGWGNGYRPVVRAMALEPGGQVLLGGFFRQLDNLPVAGLARVNGGVFDFEFRSIEGLNNGRARLRFAMPRGQHYLIEGTTNLLDWIDIGSPLVDAVETTDPAAASFGHRFYRAVRLP